MATSYIKFNGNTVLVNEVDPIERSFDKEEFVRVFVNREKIDESNFERGQTEFLLVDNQGDTAANARFGGVLKDVENQDSIIELIIESYERYARDAVPTPGGERWENVSSDTIVQDAIDNIPQLSAGTLESVGNNLTIVLSHTTQANKIRKVANAVGAEVRYRPDKTVDFVQNLGTDKTASVTISPANQNIQGTFTADKISGDEDITHLRVVGVGEGVHQREVNWVPSADPIDYEGSDDFQNVTRYSASHWSQGDRKEWETKPAKEQQDVRGLNNLAESIINDVQDREIKIETDVDGQDLSLGDTVLVDYAKKDISNLEVRVVELSKKISNKGLIDTVTLSTRTDTHQEVKGQKERSDIENYNLSFEGTPVTLTTGGGRQPVSNSINYEFSFYYPAEVKYEHRTKVLVKGSQYRAYSQGAASAGGQHSHSVDIDIPDHDHGININLPDHDHSVSINIPDHQHDVTVPLIPHKHTLAAAFLDTTQSAGHTHGYNAISPDNTIDVAAPVGDPQFAYITDDPFEFNQTVESTDDGGSEFLTETTDDGVDEIIADTSEDGGAEFLTETASSATPVHQHDPDPGVIQFSELPSNCDVLVNGSSVGVSLGDGNSAFQQEVDIEGLLTPGQVNSIEVTSDSLGHIQAHADIDVYRQILGNG